MWQVAPTPTRSQEWTKGGVGRKCNRAAAAVERKGTRRATEPHLIR